MIACSRALIEFERRGNSAREEGKRGATRRIGKRGPRTHETANTCIVSPPRPACKVANRPFVHGVNFSRLFEGERKTRSQRRIETSKSKRELARGICEAVETNRARLNQQRRSINRVCEPESTHLQKILVRMLEIRLLNLLRHNTRVPSPRLRQIQSRSFHPRSFR